jgi:hypothetical protein
LLDRDTGEYKLKREGEALRHCTDRNNKKATFRAAESFMAEINEQNNNPKKRLERQTFKAFDEGRWTAYTVNEKTQPSTLTVASLGYDLRKDSIGVQNVLGHADEIITKNIYIHISQEQASSVIEAVANKILGENSNLLAQESQSVN